MRHSDIEFNPSLLDNTPIMYVKVIEWAVQLIAKIKLRHDQMCTEVGN